MGVPPQEEEHVAKKGIGWYCNGRDVEECSAMFGGALEHVCLTCPN